MKQAGLKIDLLGQPSILVGFLRVLVTVVTAPVRGIEQRVHVQPVIEAFVLVLGSNKFQEIVLFDVLKIYNSGVLFRLLTTRILVLKDPIVIEMAKLPICLIGFLVIQCVDGLFGGNALGATRNTELALALVQILVRRIFGVFLASLMQFLDRFPVFWRELRLDSFHYLEKWVLLGLEHGGCQVAVPLKLTEIDQDLKQVLVILFAFIARNACRLVRLIPHVLAKAELLNEGTYHLLRTDLGQLTRRDQ